MLMYAWLNYLANQGLRSDCDEGEIWLKDDSGNWAIFPDLEHGKTYTASFHARNDTIPSSFPNSESSSSFSSSAQNITKK